MRGETNPTVPAATITHGVCRSGLWHLDRGEASLGPTPRVAWFENRSKPPGMRVSDADTGPCVNSSIDQRTWPNHREREILQVETANATSGRGFTYTHEQKGV